MRIWFPAALLLVLVACGRTDRSEPTPPQVLGWPLMSKDSFTVIGKPASGPVFAPARTDARSKARARFRAASKSSTQSEFKLRSWRAMRAA